ncbi:unnamed protein product, partial [marine sediment metagenome]
KGKVDKLRGLKENVILGKLIPARVLDASEGRLSYPLSGEGHEETKTTSLQLDTQITP